MDMRKTLVPVEVKELGDRVLEIAGSTEDVDRMGDIIKSKGWLLKPFKKNPVFMWAHDYNQPPIGRALKVWIDKETQRLMFEVEFADAETYAFADTIYKLYKGGFLHATSVGFIPLEWEGKDEENPNPKWEGNVFTKQELLELSAVPVPANAEALVTARESGLITVKEFEAVTKEPSEHALDAAPYLLATVTKPEETDDQIRIPVKAEEGKHKDHPIRHITIDSKKGIKALYCIDDKVIITYLFDKDNDENWTLASAQEWVDEHAKNYTLVDVTAVGDEEPQFAIQVAMEGMVEEPKPEPKEVGQEQILDDLAYIQAAIEREGLSEKAVPAALSLASEIILRTTGNDMPEDILAKVGAVLNAINKGRLTQIQELAQAVLDSAQTDDSDKRLEPVELTPDPEALKKQRALDVAEVAQVVIAQLKGKRIYKTKGVN
ncbi:hypothetical protein LCGC14_0852990 [marine sediment metagenome]|uniref:Prohead serine protease domain-containing protein n=1 Tax=marine sediment metagenome TaxID=412755 RepID=A0A0F9PEJ2_9ZZZZ